MADDKPLAGQAAIVTGGVRRIGRATALALARAGAAVVINARSSRAEADQVAQEIGAAGGRALVQLADVTNEGAVAAMADATVAAFGRIDILVNNAAAPHGEDRNFFWEVPEEAFDRVLAVNPKGNFLVSAAATRHRSRRDAG